MTTVVYGILHAMVTLLLRVVLRARQMGGGCGSVGSLTVSGINGCNTTTSNFGNVTCNGGSNGYVGVTVAGGTPGYTYQWSNGGTTATISGLTAGTYCVTVTDLNGCTSTCCHTITQPNALVANCGGTFTAPGNLQVNIIGNGFWQDEITWNLKNASNNVILSGGPYGLNTSASSATVPSVNGPFTFFIEATGSFNDNGCLWNVTCNGNIIASGCIQGTSNGGNCGAVGTLTVTGINGCTTTINPSNVTCNGGNNGVVSVAASGGTPGYTYSWSNEIGRAHV